MTFFIPGSQKNAFTVTRAYEQHSTHDISVFSIAKSQHSNMTKKLIECIVEGTGMLGISFLVIQASKNFYPKNLN